MKKGFLLLLFVLPKLFVFSQNSIDRPAELGNFGQYLQGFFEQAISDNHSDKLTTYESNNYIQMKFNIDVTGKIKNMIVEKNGIPDTFVSNLRNIIMMTDQAWSPQIKNCQAVMSDTITCYFFFKNKHSITDLLPKLDLSTKTPDQRSELMANYGRKNHCFVFLKPYLLRNPIE